MAELLLENQDEPTQLNADADIDASSQPPADMTLLTSAPSSKPASLPNQTDHVADDKSSSCKLVMDSSHDSSSEEKENKETTSSQKRANNTPMLVGLFPFSKTSTMDNSIDVDFISPSSKRMRKDFIMESPFMRPVPENTQGEL